MPKAGIAIDAWKLPIYERHLTHAGYAYTNRGSVPGFPPHTLVLTVEAQDLIALDAVVRAANSEAGAS